MQQHYIIDNMDRTQTRAYKTAGVFWWQWYQMGDWTMWCMVLMALNILNPMVQGIVAVLLKMEDEKTEVLGEQKKKKHLAEKNNNVAAQYEEVSHSQVEDVKQYVIPTYKETKRPEHSCFLLT